MQIKSQNLLSKIFGSAFLALIVALVTLIWTIYSDRADIEPQKMRLTNQAIQLEYGATQLAKQDLQLKSLDQSSQLQAEQLTAIAAQIELEKQLLTPVSTDNPDFAPTATALALRSTEIKLTQTAIASQQKRIEVTQTAIAISVPTALIKPPSKKEFLSTCLQSPYTSLGNGWTSNAMFLPTKKGAIKTFSHCPPETTIQYNSIAVDDELIQVILVCDDNTKDITNQFTQFSVENELLPFWRSSRIQLKQNCRIDFVVRDTKGENIGMMIKRSKP